MEYMSGESTQDSISFPTVNEAEILLSMDWIYYQLVFKMKLKKCSLRTQQSMLAMMLKISSKNRYC